MARIPTPDVSLVLLVLSFFSLSLLAASSSLAVAREVGGGGFENGRNISLIRKLCNATGRYYNSCVAAIEADPRSDLKSEPTGILRILMDKTLSNTTTLNDYITLLLAANDTRMDNNTRESIYECSDIYTRAIYFFKGGYALINCKNGSEYDDLQYSINGILDAPFICEQIFIELQRPALFTVVGNYIQDLSGAVLDMAAAIYPNFQHRI